MAVQSRAGPYQMREAVFVTSMAARSWPVLWPMAPRTLTTQRSFSGKAFTASAITAQDMYDLKDLGIHTEMMTSTMGEMIRRGVVTGERKNFHKGEHIACFAGGDRALYETIATNPSVRMMPGTWAVDPMIIMQNDNMVSINTCIEMDLTGQITAESVGARQFSGSGGAFDFAYGALRSKGGRGIYAFTSLSKKGQSRINAILAPGAQITIPRNYADYVVTEYGIAPLRGRSVRERTKNLIAIAHPDFRAELTRQAEELNYI